MIRDNTRWLEGDTLPSDEPKPLSSKERIAKQRSERLSQSDKDWAYIQANEERYAQQRAEVQASRDQIQLDPDKAYWPPYNPLAEEGSKQLDVKYIKPLTSIAVLSIEEAQEFYTNLGGKDSLGALKDYGGLAGDLSGAVVTAKGLGGLGVKAYTKNINGKDWVIIKDFRRHQQTLMKGNKWLASNPKVVQAGMGLSDLRGAVRYVKFNVGVEVAFAIGINAADYIMKDEATLSEFVENSASDLAKGVVSLAGATLITAAVVPASVGVLVSGTVFALVSFGLGSGLDVIEENGYITLMTEKVKEHFK
ncbi:hypothetical protein [Vibrio europaeus]|uniref:hypothetical protein n=1 Tax=Vibrio europaeus TaxID=300876 RepID=UPI00233EE055|nr:hypothetical protein [Vibrio europaeus]MDC5718402.1 hypothetical protein [Vibrio europaeus]